MNKFVIRNLRGKYYNGKMFVNAKNKAKVYENEDEVLSKLKQLRKRGVDCVHMYHN